MILPAAGEDNAQEETDDQADTSETTPDRQEDKPDNAPVAALKPYCEPLVKAIEGTNGEDGKSTTAEQRIVAALDTLDAECKEVTSALETSTERIQTIHRDARDGLASRGHPTGSAERQAKKTAYEAAESDFNTYVELWQQWDTLEKERLALFETLKGLCIRRTEIRRTTAEVITKRLAADLDPAIIRIKADAQPVSDRTKYFGWFQDNVRWHRAQYKEKRFEELAKRISPESLRRQLLSRNGHDLIAFVVDKPTNADGRITTDDAKVILAGAAGIQQLEAETSGEEDQKYADSLPKEVREGLWIFPGKEGSTEELLVDGVLKLDEVVLDDLPVILLNDRPSETEHMRPLERLSPGQRCSAILPILLLNGTAPLVIDQPEDNLDNRLIRQVIVNVLASIKLHRQVIVATHNPNLPVLGDAEQVIVLRAVEDEQCILETQGVLDDASVVRSITEVMEGGREAFQYRHAIYQKHWAGGADLND